MLWGLQTIFKYCKRRKQKAEEHLEEHTIGNNNNNNYYYYIRLVIPKSPPPTTAGDGTQLTFWSVGKQMEQLLMLQPLQPTCCTVGCLNNSIATLLLLPTLQSMTASQAACYTASATANLRTAVECFDYEDGQLQHTSTLGRKPQHFILILILKANTRAGQALNNNTTGNE